MISLNPFDERPNAHGRHPDDHKSIFDYPAKWTIADVRTMKHWSFVCAHKRSASPKTPAAAAREAKRLDSILNAFHTLEEVAHSNQTIRISQIPRTIEGVINQDQFRWWFMGIRLNQELRFATVAGNAKCSPFIVSDMEEKGTIPPVDTFARIIKTLDTSLSEESTRDLHGHLAQLPPAQHTAGPKCPDNIATYKRALQEIRERCEVSVNALASALRTSRQYISGYESLLNSYSPDAESLARIAKALTLSPQEIEILEDLRRFAQKPARTSRTAPSHFMTASR